MRIALLTLLVTLLVAAFSQTKDNLTATITRNPNSNFSVVEVTFTNDMKPIFKRYCVSCHAGILNYEVAYKQRGKIYNKFVKNSKMPPKYAEQPSQVDVDLVKAWIEQGAKK